MNFGWTADYCLNMPAVLFFSLSKSARQVYAERMNHFLAELCDVAICSTGNSKYHSELKGIYEKRVFGDMNPPPRHGVFDLSKKEQSMAAAMKLASMLRGGTRGR